MLVLSRKIGERIVIPDCDLTITVVAVEGGKVKLGFSAPKEVAVFREEVWRQIDDEAIALRPSRPARPGRPVSKVPTEPFFLTVHHHGDNHEFAEE
jgi:carbon storage regulator